MAVENIKSIESSEQNLAPASSDIQIMTLDTFLDKEVNNPAVREKINPIIDDIKKDIPENDIIDCFQNDFSPFLMAAQIFEPKESKEFFIDQIMDYFRSIGKSIDTVQTQISEEE
ncbi:hypothetical protein KKG31_06045 [Patescibacteria group bacterium]|nr:hypothetical protein [Patescibacteria group bacterium]